MAAKPSSITRTAVAAISAGRCRAVLSPLGFRRAAPQYWRMVDGLSQCVNFQASAWGSHEKGCFTINLGVSSPMLYETYTGTPLPRAPAAALWPVNERIGKLMPDRKDHWWDVDANTDVDALGEEVAGVIRDYAVPWLTSLATREALIRAIAHGTTPLGMFALHVPIALAIFAAEDGDTARAASILGAALDDIRGKPGERMVRHIGDRLGFALDP